MDLRRGSRFTRIPFASLMIVAACLFGLNCASQTPPPAPNPVEQLGKRLFMDKRLSNPGSHFEARCASCHIPEDFAGLGRRYADVLPQSLVPSSKRGFKQTTRRNAPVLMGIRHAPRLNWDGQFSSLEDLLHWKLTSPQLGWLPGEEEQAWEEVFMMIVQDEGFQVPNTRPFYVDYKEAFDVDLSTLDREEVLDYAVRALAAFVRALEPTFTSPFDRMVVKTGADPREERTIAEWQELVSRLADDEALSEDAKNGMLIFFRTKGDAHAGNCVTCHTPPYFTNFAFSTTGVAQIAHNAEHGVGRYKEAAADRKVVSTADLGHWVYAEPSLRDVSIGAFKTPPLRNLSYTDPYMHNGAYETLEDAMLQKIAAHELALKGELANAAPALKAMRLNDTDIAPLVAFLEMLDEDTTPDIPDFPLDYDEE